MTLTLPVGCVSSVGVGVAVCRAIREQIGEAPGGREGAGRIGLRWPNDVVEREGGRKLAGVLIETRGRVALAGIGVNVHQLPDDFPAEIRGRATSVAACGGVADRLCVACAVLKELARVIEADAPTITREAAQLDTIVGTRREFVSDGRAFAGEVASFGTDGSILLLLDGGGEVSLPASTTSLVPEEPGAHE